MAQKKLGPGALRRKRPSPGIDQLAGSINFENISPLKIIQARHLIERFGVAPNRASIIAPLVFENGRRTP